MTESTKERCPTCNSPEPKLHPALQPDGGEIQLCSNAFHKGMTEPTKELIPADGFERTVEWPDPTPEMLNDPRFEAIWNVIKSWDINVPAAYSGYCGATGNHVRAILDTLLPNIDAFAAQRVAEEQARLEDPPEAVIARGVQMLNTPRSGPDETLVHDIWQAMLDEIRALARKGRRKWK